MWCYRKTHPFDAHMHCYDQNDCFNAALAPQPRTLSGYGTNMFSHRGGRTTASPSPSRGGRCNIAGKVLKVLCQLTGLRHLHVDSEGSPTKALLLQLTQLKQLTCLSLPHLQVNRFGSLGLNIVQEVGRVLQHCSAVRYCTIRYSTVIGESHPRHQPASQGRMRPY
jgi:hypothetical protein